MHLTQLVMTAADNPLKHTEKDLVDQLINILDYDTVSLRIDTVSLRIFIL